MIFIITDKLIFLKDKRRLNDKLIEDDNNGTIYFFSWLILMIYRTKWHNILDKTIKKIKLFENENTGK